MDKLHALYVCFFDTAQTAVAGLVGALVGVPISVLLLFHPRSPLNVVLPVGNYQYGGIVIGLCLLLGAQIGFVIGALVTRSCGF